MLRNIAFYLRHSYNDLRVNKRLTFFALLAVAAGVAAIVSLQTLAVMIDDTLEGNLQETNRGDVSAVVTGGNDNDVRSGTVIKDTMTFFGGDETDTYLSAIGLQQVQDWVEEHYPGTEITYRAAVTGILGMFTGIGNGTAVTHAETGDQVTSVTPLLIDPTVYPFYSDVITEDGAALEALLQAPTDIVVSQNIARDLALEIGDTVRLNGADTDFTVRGVVKTETEVKGFTNGIDFFAGLFGFYYIHAESGSLFDDYQTKIAQLYFKLDESVDTGDFAQQIGGRFSFFDTTSTEDLREMNEQIVAILSDVVTVMGLVSLLIGSIGIINTMNVVVRRRTLEVAVLKTLGLQAEQVTLLFLSEAFILGVLGSLVGVVLGWGLTFIIRSAAETVFSTTLPFRIALSPALNGIIVGVLVTTVFGFLPTLAAGQVRPGIVLRPMDNIVPKAGRVRSFFALLIVIVALSLIARTVLGSLLLAFAIVAGTFIAAGLLFVILWVMIWLIAKLFPTFGIVDLKVALRQMMAGRSRGASTLLALAVGVFSLSIITLFVESALGLFEDLLQESGNVMISTSSRQTAGQIGTLLDDMEGANSYTTMIVYGAALVSFNDTETGTAYTPEQLTQIVQEADIPRTSMREQRHPEWYAPENILQNQLINTQIEGRSLDHLNKMEMASGRYLAPQDAGQPVIVLTENSVFTVIGLSVGDTLTYRVQGQAGLLGRGSGDEEITFTIIGLIAESSMGMQFSDADLFAPVEAFPASLNPNTVMIMADIAEETIPQLRRDLQQFPGTFALEMTVFTRMIHALVNTFTAFPMMLAALGLFVGGVVIANSVALSTMERRKEIAIMKSVGLQRERVLGMLLLENGLLGLVGGLFGVGISLLALVVMEKFTEVPDTSISLFTVTWLMSLCIGIALLAALSSAWSASGEKPLNVLRYE